MLENHITLKMNFFLWLTKLNLWQIRKAIIIVHIFFFFADPDIQGIYWAVPQSTKVEKYRSIIEHKIKKYGKCNTIIIEKFANKDNAFLIQNMFPIIEKYVDHEHTINGVGVTIHTNVSKKVTSNALQILSLHKRGKNFIFPDVDKIYKIMKNELQNNA